MADVPMPKCLHEQVQTWFIEGTHTPAGLWSCVDCGAKFEPLAQHMAEIAAEREKARGLVEALEALIANRDKYHPDRERFVETSIGSYWSPSASMIGSDAVAAARAALAAMKEPTNG